MTQAITLENIKTGFDKYRNFINKFIYTDFYLAFVCIFYFIAWIIPRVMLTTPTGAKIGAIFGMTGAIIIACLVLLGSDDILPLTVNLFGAIMMIFSSKFGDFTYMWPLAFPFAICLVYFLVKNGRHKFTLGKMFFPLVAVAYALLLGGVGTLIKQDFIRALPNWCLLGLGVPAVYMLYNHYLKRDSQRDVPLYFAKTLMYMGIIMCIQLIITIAQSKVPVSGWYNQVWDVGWATRNRIATYLMFTSAMTMYLSTRYRQGWIFLGLSIFQYVCIIISFSRGAIIFSALSGLAALIFTFIKVPNKKLHTLYICVAILVGLILYLCFMRSVNSVISSLVARGTGTSGRNKLFEEAWGLFKAHPFFGAGEGYVGGNTKLSGVGTYWFHNTLLQILACMGIMGLIAYGYFYIARLKILFKNINNSFNLFCLAIFIGFEGYSLLNPGTFQAYPFMYLVIIITLLQERIQIDYSGFVTPYNYSTPWGDLIVQKETAFIEKFRAQTKEFKERRQAKKL